MTLPKPPEDQEISILILAGGRGSRMNGRDKGLMELAGKPCIEHLLARLDKRSPILISANRHLNQYRRYGYPVIRDFMAGFPGPLAGFVSALDIMNGHYLLTVPVDAPLLCRQYSARMNSAMKNTDSTAVVAEYNGRMEPVFSLLRRDSADTIRSYLQAGGRSVGDCLANMGAQHVDFTDCPQQFINLNEPGDVQRLEQQLTNP
jgi:molybdopterin-guanine dinucleotide biosynthesis protein A